MRNHIIWKILSGFISIYLIFGQQCLKAESVCVSVGEQKASENLLCAFINLTPIDSSDKPLRVIYPICLLTGDTVLDASMIINEDDTASFNKEKSRSILNKFRDFSIFSRGKIIGQALVDSIIKGNFDCNDICVGKGKFTNIDTLLDFEYLGFNMNSSLANSQKEIKYVPDSVISHYGIDSRIKKIYKNENVPPKYIKGNPFLFKAECDFNNDGSDDIIIGSGIDTNGIKISYVAVFNVKDSIATMWQLLNREDESSWGNGHRIIDLLDVDFDGVPEIIVKYSGYEVVAFQIYKFDNETFMEIFSGASYGC